MAKKEKSLEASFEEINGIVQKLEMDDVSLEDSFHLYQEGMKLIKFCNESIDKVEKKLLVLGEMNESDEI